MLTPESLIPSLSREDSLIRKPEWLKIRLKTNEAHRDVSELLREKRLHTVCRSARCPNAGECWSRGTATFMILGDVCTRNCRFCAVATGQPEPIDEDEPRRLAEAAVALDLKWVVLTSVDRDDLPDGGAGPFVSVIHALREALPEAGIEALVPDFLRKPRAIDILCAEPPDVLNHNIETVPRLYPSARPQASYRHSLWVISQFAERGLATKSGLMVGLGETLDEVRATFRDLKDHGCQCVTVGQYLRPSREHLPVARYVHPDEFAELAEYGYSMGFDHVAAGPLVRSSYRAEEAGEMVKRRSIVDTSFEKSPFIA